MTYWVTLGGFVGGFAGGYFFDKRDRTPKD